MIDSPQFEEKLREKSRLVFFVINYKMSNLEKENFFKVEAYEKLGYGFSTEDFCTL